MGSVHRLDGWGLATSSESKNWQQLSRSEMVGAVFSQKLPIRFIRKENLWNESQSKERMMPARFIYIDRHINNSMRTSSILKASSPQRLPPFSLTPNSNMKNLEICSQLEWHPQVCQEEIKCVLPSDDVRSRSQTWGWFQDRRWREWHHSTLGIEGEQKRSTFSSLSRYSTSLVVRHQIKETGAHFNIPYFHIKEFNDFCSFWWGGDTRNFHSTGGRVKDNWQFSSKQNFLFSFLHNPERDHSGAGNIKSGVALQFAKFTGLWFYILRQSRRHVY